MLGPACQEKSRPRGRVLFPAKTATGHDSKEAPNGPTSNGWAMEHGECRAKRLIAKIGVSRKKPAAVLVPG